jgi:hypothetical protein
MKFFDDKKNNRQWKKINSIYNLFHSILGFSFLLSLYSQPDWLLIALASIAFTYILLRSLTYAYFSIVRKFVPENILDFMPFSRDTAPVIVGFISLLIFFSGTVYLLNLIYNFY